MKKLKLTNGLLRSAFFLVAQIGLAVFGLYYQFEESNQGTQGVSLGFFSGMVIFYALTTVLSYTSAIRERTISAFLKILPYAAGVFAYSYYIFNCKNLRDCKNQQVWMPEDTVTIMLLIFVSLVIFFFHFQKDRRLMATIKDPYFQGYWGAGAVGIAQIMYAYHFIATGDTSGTSLAFLVCGLITIVIRIVQNVMDLHYDGSSPIKKSLLIGDYSNLVTWMAILIVFASIVRPTN